MKYIELIDTERQALIELIDIAVKARGLAVAAVGVELATKIRDAIPVEKPAS